ncbi:MAG: DUF4430 domain-containing protein [Lachnospiraceae bacterium]|nr:DUF4430 domain-containing protein [Lachnospiraceae bacterium]
MKSNKKLLTLLLSLMLVAAMAFVVTGCNKKEEAVVSEVTVHEDGEVIGEGSKEFAFTVVNMEGEETNLEIHTDKETVGEALLELGVIAGEDSEYGLYVKTVNGETVDYDKDGKYWAFYINGEYGMTGVDTTKIAEGESYAFKAE